LNKNKPLSTEQTVTEELLHSWAIETPRKRFASPYSWGTGENLVWLKNNLFGPSDNHQELTQFIEQEVQLHQVESQIKIAFIGDVMPTKEGVFRIGPSLKLFLDDVDYLVLNLEGPIGTDKKGFNALRHDKSIMGLLEDMLPPEKIVVCMTNNHAADCGWEEYNRCYNLFKTYGYNVCGRRDQPSVLLQDMIQITACSFWSNQQCEFISYYKEAREELESNAAFNILYPHWGYEMQLYPNPKQIEFGKKMLERWDMVLGHHSHCPQPITRDSGKLLAYSLGDFCYATRSTKYHNGIIVKADIGQDSQGTWLTGKVNWKFTRQSLTAEKTYVIDAFDKCRFFSGLI